MIFLIKKIYSNILEQLNRSFYPFGSISLCLNAPPLENFLEDDFNDYKEHYNGTKYSTSTIRLNVTQIVENENLFNNFARGVTLEEYRKGVISWVSWQDHFMLSVFLLLALLSIGAIVAFKV